METDGIAVCFGSCHTECTSVALVYHSFFIKDESEENQKKNINRHIYPPHIFSLFLSAFHRGGFNIMERICSNSCDCQAGVVL